MDNHRKQEALSILKDENIKNLRYLGSGHESVVFTDEIFAFVLIFIALGFNKLYFTFRIFIHPDT